MPEEPRILQHMEPKVIYTVAFIGGLLLVWLIIFIQIEVVLQHTPMWMWQTDACPQDPDLFCGQVAMGPLLVALGNAIIGAIGISAVARYSEWGETDG